VHCELSKDLAIKSYIRTGQSVYELTVGQTVLTRGGINTRNPQGSELALLLAAVAIGVLASFDHCLLGDTKTAAASAAIALGLIKDALMSLVSRDTAFHSWHDDTSLLSCFLSMFNSARLAGQELADEDFIARSKWFQASALTLLPCAAL